MAIMTEKAANGIGAPAPAGRVRARLRSRGVLVIGLRVLAIAAVIGFWQLASGRLVPDYAISRPTEVVTALRDYLGSSAGWLDIQTTAEEIVLGFALGVALGVVMGLVLGTFRLAGQVLEPLVAAVNGIPKIALAPLFLLFFGIGEWSKIAIATTGVSFVVFYNIYLGLRLRERELVEIVQVMGGRPHHVLSYVTIPTLAAPFFAALKTGGPLAILGVIGGEFIASSQGVGHELFTAAENLDAASEFAGLIVLVALTLILNSMLTWLDNFALKHLGLAARGRRA
ncbi:ABC transporter permease [Actinospica sp. MGRD01-02]|uniref:ABC transporter permease n=1 Tax=Actinospica acidithermotolerans TaxID=2828514 RepID=A0A941IKR9_9ACTN|nr:ABC transporter permease [Actinospica acidithermotolerans]MBR7826961.1 ABC transporter permease [Actinospica acidithermotolerans]